MPIVRDEDDLGRVPIGGIIWWGKAISLIPSNYALCDGNNGTPDMTDYMPIHADADSGGTRNVGSTYGANTYDISHAHATTGLGTDTTGAHTHTGGGTSGNIDNSGTRITDSQGGHAHTITGSVDTGGSATQAVLPKCKAIPFIMRIS